MFSLASVFAHDPSHAASLDAVEISIRTVGGVGSVISAASGSWNAAGQSKLFFSIAPVHSMHLNAF